MDERELLILDEPADPDLPEQSSVLDLIAAAVDVAAAAEGSLLAQDALSLLTPLQRAVIVATVLEQMSYGACLTSDSQLYGLDSVDLLARLIYSEAGNQTWAAMQGVAFVANNRKLYDINNDTSYFGGTTFESVILAGGSSNPQFDGIWSSNGLCPNTTTTAWSNSLYIAENMATQNNPIGGCLWFMTNAAFAAGSRTYNGVLQYNFGSGWRNVTEYYVFDQMTYFLVTPVQ